jgi:hypothetical protein
MLRRIGSAPASDDRRHGREPRIAASLGTFLASGHRPETPLSESDPYARVHQSWAAGKDSARTIDDEEVIEKVLDREKHRHAPEIVIHRGVPDSMGGDQTALSVWRRHDGIQVVAELMARVDGFEQKVESGRMRIPMTPVHDR